MSEGPTLPRRWFPCNLFVTAVAIVTLSIFPAYASAGDGAAALPRRVTRPITKVLPDTWTCESKGSRLVLRPRKQPVFVNLTNAERRDSTETLDDYHRRHIVKLDYQIVLRFEPKLSFAEVCSLIDKNEGIHHGLQSLDRSPLAFWHKGFTSFPKTPEGVILSQQRDQLLQSFRSVPAGYLGNMSVYIESTDFRFATFLHEEEEREAEAVEKRIRDQLSPYTSEPTNPPPK